jgi:hypothetical protein
MHPVLADKRNVEPFELLSLGVLVVLAVLAITEILHAPLRHSRSHSRPKLMTVDATSCTQDEYQNWPSFRPQLRESEFQEKIKQNIEPFKAVLQGKRANQRGQSQAGRSKAAVNRVPSFITLSISRPRKIVMHPAYMYEPDDVNYTMGHTFLVFRELLR